MQILKENIRDCILKVARQQFEQKGYSKTSMREIAESEELVSGISITTSRTKMICFVR